MHSLAGDSQLHHNDNKQRSTYWIRAQEYRSVYVNETRDITEYNASPLMALKKPAGMWTKLQLLIGTRKCCGRNLLFFYGKNDSGKVTMVTCHHKPRDLSNFLFVS